MSFSFGDNIRITVFGQSHSAAMGVVIEGLPAGFEPDEGKLAAFMSRRAPGRDKLSTPRKESDSVKFISGLVNGKTCGAPLCAMIENTNTRSADYDELRDVPRPSHADFAAWAKFGENRDVSGGGQFSARLTAPLCIAGGLCMQLLEKEGIFIGTHIAAVGSVHDSLFDPVNVSPTDFPTGKDFPVLDDAAGEKMQKLILDARADGDSVGGVVECAVCGMKPGYGDALFGGMEGKISSAVFAVPAVKGIEFGSGFSAAEKRGSENNDAFEIRNGGIATVTNNHGGILGGITSGMPIIFRAAFKPTPSIAKTQQSVSLSGGKNVALNIKGRHDPCVVKRGTVCIEAAAAIAVYDIYKKGTK